MVVEYVMGLMVDRVVICGSANLNDRSQQGDRDSEVAVVIEDPPVHPARINGTQVHFPICVSNEKWNVSPFAASLRRRLFREHLGLLPPDHYDNITSNSHPLPAENQYDWNSNEDRLVEDPLSPEFWNILSTTAQRNTEIFRNIFHSVPDDGGMQSQIQAVNVSP
jgi:phospholipase D1/2